MGSDFFEIFKREKLYLTIPQAKELTTAEKKAFHADELKKKMK